MSSKIAPIELICLAAERLAHLRESMTFLGGSVVGLLVTDTGARLPRATEDVDVTIEIGTRMAYYELENQLRALGFQNDMMGPTCRFVHPPLVLDVMPTNQDILGVSNRWYPVSIRTAEPRILPNDIVINLISPACFLATKLEAFDSLDRENHGDMMTSRDFEDIVVVIDGRSTIVEDVLTAEPMIRAFLQDRFAFLFAKRSLEDGIAAHLESDLASQARITGILQRIEAISTTSL